MKKIPYATQWISDQDIDSVQEALRGDFLTQGPMVDAFEKAVASYCGARFAVAVNSGTSALHLACLAAGLGKGDEGITSPITFVASANAMLYCGAKPVFADVCEDDACIDPKEIAKKISKRTKAIIPVHFAGQPCEMAEINAIAKKNKLIIIEDAAHALGAKYRGSKIGSGKYSDMTTLSFHAVKHITTGEGGMVLTNDSSLRDKLLFYRSHGICRGVPSHSDEPWYYEMQCLGYNYRLTDFQSALGISQLKQLEKFVCRREEIAEIYDRNFAQCEGIQRLAVRNGVRSARHLYVIRVEEREKVFKRLRENGIMANVHYIPVYRQPYYRQNGYKRVNCKRAENYYRQAISLPMYPKLTDRQVNYVIDSVIGAVNGKL